LFGEGERDERPPTDAFFGKFLFLDNFEPFVFFLLTERTPFVESSVELFLPSRSGGEADDDDAEGEGEVAVVLMLLEVVVGEEFKDDLVGDKGLEADELAGVD
tara:strand:- start:83 stop:391 length:309 start_codon:yes stop_codon:yes gene_type:complete